MNKSGSSLLVLVIIIHIVALSLIHVWRTTTLYVDLVVQKQQVFQRSVAINGLLIWALDFYKHQSRHVLSKLDKQGCYEIPVFYPLTKSLSMMRPYIKFERFEKDMLRLSAYLVYNDKKIGEKSCDLQLKKSDNNNAEMRIMHWY